MCPTLALNRIPVFTADLAFNVRVTAFSSHGYIRQCVYVCVWGGGGGGRGGVGGRVNL